MPRVHHYQGCVRLAAHLRSRIFLTFTYFFFLQNYLLCVTHTTKAPQWVALGGSLSCVFREGNRVADYMASPSRKVGIWEASCIVIHYLVIESLNGLSHYCVSWSREYYFILRFFPSGFSSRVFIEARFINCLWFDGQSMVVKFFH